MPVVDMPSPAVAARDPKAGRRPWTGVAVVTVAGLLLALVAAAVLSGRYQIRPVLSGSMRPGLPVGGVVVTKRIPLTDVKVRDVIVFTRPNEPSQLVVHRVISLTSNGSSLIAKTQGDANDAPDPWTLSLEGHTAYRAVFSVPLVGYPAVWLHSPGGRRATLTAIGLIVMAVAAVTLRRERKRSKKPSTNDIADAEASQALADALEAPLATTPRPTLALADRPTLFRPGRLRQTRGAHRA